MHHKTTKNLNEAFAGESQANRKYLAFAKQAEKDGYPNIAKLFRGVAEAETVHAHNHLKTLGGVRSTTDNIESAIEGEGFEFKEMYPKFIRDAEEEDKRAAATGFKYANSVEQIHHKLYSEALEEVKKGNDISVGSIYVCGVCGMTVENEAPDICPVCSAPKSSYLEIN